MKKLILLLLLINSLYASSQSLIQTVNSGSVIASNGSFSVGEIIIVPTQNQSQSGIIGILAQINQQTLAVSQFEITENIVVYPNPTVAQIHFETTVNLQSEKISIYNELGQLVSENQLDANNSLDLSTLSTGIYLIQFDNKNYKSFKIIKN